MTSTLTTLASLTAARDTLLASSAKFVEDIVAGTTPDYASIREATETLDEAVAFINTSTAVDKLSDIIREHSGDLHDRATHARNGLAVSNDATQLAKLVDILIDVLTVAR